MQFFNYLFPKETKPNNVDFFRLPPPNTPPSPPAVNVNMANYFQQPPPQQNVPPSTPTAVHYAQSNLYNFSLPVVSNLYTPCNQTIILTAEEETEHQTLVNLMEYKIAGSWQLSPAVYQKLSFEGVSSTYELREISNRLYLNYKI
ncbi:MAG: hypothetical protein Q8K75_11045 [Chlamydiales bacterium]|nr:hypothetical protein [Chlamydiales bacterium]